MFSIAKKLPLPHCNPFSLQSIIFIQKPNKSIKMNKRFFTYAIATALLAAGIGLTACNEDNSWEPTGVNG